MVGRRGCPAHKLLSGDASLLELGNEFERNIGGIASRSKLHGFRLPSRRDRTDDDPSLDYADISESDRTGRDRRGVRSHPVTLDPPTVGAAHRGAGIPSRKLRSAVPRLPGPGGAPHWTYDLDRAGAVWLPPVRDGSPSAGHPGAARVQGWKP
ncbi:hypothetical protein GCM10010166_61680 [Couchioplanes caeruleus subsp. azureus]|nr:hypothetical protein GCM10010166_61680 [Couchioplanes caeruleus subsp. azureus]